MPNRIRVALVATLTVISSLMAAAPAGAATTPQKVVIIVGPTGAQTDNYRSKGDAIYAAAVAAGATAVKVYSPNATWANVKAAVNGANIVVYLGHGNGFPNPYGTTELTDRHNGWGLNRTNTNGDGDNWGTTMVYCGERVLRGMLTSSDDSARLTYCGGTANDGITPAPNWVMIYSNACYAPGASEGSDTPATETKALERVRNYSFPSLSVGGGAYFATDMHDGPQQLVDTILRNPGMPFGEVAENANGYDLSRQRHFAHPDLAGTRIWIQNTGDATSGDYFFAYAGRPALTPSGTTVAYSEPVVPTAPSLVARSPAPNATGVASTVQPSVRFDRVVTGVSTASFLLRKGNVTTLVGTVTAAGDGMSFTFHPAAPLVAGASYTVKLSSAIKGTDGVSLTPVSWSFTVAGTSSGSSGTTTYNPARSLTFLAGTHTGYKFDSAGHVTASKAATLASSSSAPTTQRRSSLPGQTGAWFQVSAGIWAGYWVRESPKIYLPGISAQTSYAPARLVGFAAGTYTGYKFDSAGHVIASKAATLASSSSASADKRAIINGRAYLGIVNGIWAGYWVAESSSVYLR